MFLLKSHKFSIFELNLYICYPISHLSSLPIIHQWKHLLVHCHSLRLSFISTINLILWIFLLELYFCAFFNTCVYLRFIIISILFLLYPSFLYHLWWCQRFKVPITVRYHIHNWYVSSNQCCRGLLRRQHGTEH